MPAASPSGRLAASPSGRLAASPSSPAYRYVSPTARAAINLQRCWRGFLGRRRFRERQEAYHAWGSVVRRSVGQHGRLWRRRTRERKAARAAAEPGDTESVRTPARSLPAGAPEPAGAIDASVEAAERQPLGAPAPPSPAPYVRHVDRQRKAFSSTEANPCCGWGCGYCACNGGLCVDRCFYTPDAAWCHGLCAYRQECVWCMTTGGLCAKAVRYNECTCCCFDLDCDLPVRPSSPPWPSPRPCSPC